MRAQQYAVYKGVTGKFGAIQFNFQPPHYYHPDTKEKDFNETKVVYDKDEKAMVWKGSNKARANVREGAIFVEITSTKEGQKNVYDWDNKVIMALSVDDLGKLLYFMKTGKDPKGNDELKIMHDPGANSPTKGKIQKHLNFSAPKGIAAGMMVNVSEVKGQDRISHTVPMSGNEVMVLSTLVQSAISRALAW